MHRPAKSPERLPIYEWARADNTAQYDEFQ